MDEADHQKEYVEWQLQWTRWVHQLGECLVQLKQQALFLDLAPIFVTEDNKTSVNQTQVQGRRWLPPVLCHMDCQPQNLLCYRRRLESRVHNTPSSQRAKVNDASFLTPDNDANHDSTSIRIVSILDWEDAALADPRFEIMMLCRKVCANLDQARWVWNLYANECRIIGRSGDDDDKKVAIGIERMGPIEPWLQLETVHSITTLLLQSVKSVVGSSNDGSTLTCQPLNGRNPWETPKDVQAKLQQEFQRLKTQWPIQIEP
jgi:thiamine kinase-like enzyme